VSDFRIVVLASGSGTLFQELIDARQVHQGKIVGLITDVECPAIDRAKRADIPHNLIPVGKDRASWDLNLTNSLKQYKPDLIVSAGFMKIIGPQVLAAFSGRIINTHPALLPKFPGAHAVADALAAGEKVTGSTIHFVDEGVDTGEVIAQEKVEIEVSDTENTLHERIKVTERKLLVNVVAKFVSGELMVKAGN
jgi:phosphoribosylglycinamide formyltransferase-1